MSDEIAVQDLARKIVRAYTRDDRREPSLRDIEIAEELHAEIAARVQAAQVEMREACADHLETMRRAHAKAMVGVPHTPDTGLAFSDGADAIRALPLTTDALSAMLAQARREGMEAAAKIADRSLPMHGLGGLTPEEAEEIGIHQEIARAIRSAAVRETEE
jgi:hypothetical protein